MSVILQILLSMIIFMGLCSATPAAVEPPTIIKGASMPTMYLSSQPNANIPLPCTATGTKPLEHEWLRDGENIGNENTDKLNVAYDSTKSAVDGYYQCRVRNSLGTALSNVTRIITARQAVFDKADKRLCPAVIGKPLRVECKWANMGVPTPDRANFYWSGITTSKRVQIDDTGNLYISAVKQEDIVGVVRSCQIRNNITNVIASGSDVQITEEQSTEAVTPQKPKILFCSNYSDNANSVNTKGQTTIIAIEGKSASLRCFFGGSENVQIEWRRYNVKPPVERMSIINADSELSIRHVLDTDEGEFECIGTNTAGQTSFKTIVNVYAIPEFKTIAAQPHNVNASVGDNLTFNCTAYSRPTASVQWFINGDKLEPESSRPNKFRLSSDGSSLTVVNLCKNNCTGGHNDIMVVQCNASNAFGSAFSNGYINVFERTVFTVKPVDVNDVVFPDSVSFYAHAESDISTPVIYKWYHEGQLLANDDKYLIDDNGNLTITKTDGSDLGKYRCVATNGISHVEETVTLGHIAIASILPWIVLMILLILLFLFAVILFIGCMIYQNRGDDYLVDETERKCGNDPDKDLADAELQPFSRQDNLNLSTHSLGRSDKGSTHSLVNEGGDTVRRPSNFGTLQ